jgi:hypothetical protein
MKQIPGLDGYWATEDGRIISTRDGERTIKPRDADGYLCVTLSVTRDGKRARHRFAVHRLVCLAFRGLPPEGHTQTRHLNGVRTDNRASNLVWGTPKQNAADAIVHGTLGKGMKARHRKLDEQQVVQLKARLAQGEHTKSLAAEFGVSLYYPNQIAAGRNWA